MARITMGKCGTGSLVFNHKACKIIILQGSKMIDIDRTNSFFICTLTLVVSIFWAWFFHRILSYPENHVGWNFMIMEFPSFILAASSAYHFSMNRNKLYLLIVMASIASSLLLAVIFYTNILVPYEEWLARGMPDRPF
jgi:peptidoglycan/LPS O-acetylase OafA/YrhL